MGKISGPPAPLPPARASLISVQRDQKKDKTVPISFQVTHRCRRRLEKSSFSQVPNMRIIKGLRATTDVPNISVVPLVSELLE
jgi:hypothetical protein